MRCQSQRHFNYFFSHIRNTRKCLGANICWAAYHKEAFRVDFLRASLLCLHVAASSCLFRCSFFEQTTPLTSKCHLRGWISACLARMSTREALGSSSNAM